MGRKKNKNKQQNDEKHSTEHPSYKNAELFTVPDCSSQGQKTLHQHNENKVDDFSVRDEILENPPRELIMTEKSFYEDQQQKPKMSDSATKKLILVPNTTRDIQCLVNLWSDSIIEQYKKYFSVANSHEKHTRSSDNAKSGTKKANTDTRLNNSPSFNESICYEACVWLHMTWAWSCQHNGHKRCMKFERSDVMRYVEFILQGWNKQIQVSIAFEKY